MAEPQVDFIIAGAQKGGTTALFDYLSDAGDLRLSRVKETHFFDDESRDWVHPDYADYHAQFDAPDGRPAGEATPIYLYWPNSLERIQAYNPRARIIVALRDPVERAWSHWRMEYSRGAETKPFAWCIREGRQRLLASQPWGFHREFSYVERGFYGEQVERLLGLFPREQVLVLRSDDLKRDPATALTQVRGLIGLPPSAAPVPRSIHVGREMDYGSALEPADVAFLDGLYARDRERLADLTGVRLSRS